MIFDLYYISCTYVKPICTYIKPMNCMVLGINNTIKIIQFECGIVESELALDVNSWFKK